MSATPSSHPTVGFLARHYVELLTALVLLFILQGSLIPLDFGALRSGDGSHVFFDARMFDLAFADIISNIFLYVPLGVLVYWLLSRRVTNRFFAFMLTVIFAGLLSVSIEYVQAYSPSRVSSLIDVVSNIFGAVIGASLSWVGRWIIPNVVGAALYEFHEQPRAALVKSYAVVLVVFAALPFSFSVDPGRLKQAVHSANFVPFATTTPSWPPVDEAEVPPSLRTLTYQRWHDSRRWARWTVECASFALLAILLQQLLRDDYAFSRRYAMALTWWIAGGLAIALSILQLPIISRACDITDVLFRVAGIGVGLGVRAMHLRAIDGLNEEKRVVLWDRRLQWACGVTLAYILFTGVIPFTYSWDPGSAARSLASREFLPFFAYFVGRFDLMMADVMEKFASFALLGGLLAMTWRRVVHARPDVRILKVCGVCVLVSCVIEAAQLFNPVRVTSLTDPILAACGGIIGVIAQSQFASFYRYAVTHDAKGPANPIPEQMQEPDTPSARGFTLSDAMIASLADPYDDAPVEPGEPIRRKPRT